MRVKIPTPKKKKSSPQSKPIRNLLNNKREVIRRISLLPLVLKKNLKRNLKKKSMKRNSKRKD